MERMFLYFAKYSISFEQELVDYLRDKGKLKSYKKGVILKLPEEPYANYGFVLDGMIGKLRENDPKTDLLERVCLPYDYYVGTKHPFSSKNEMYTIVALLNSTVYEISNQHWRYALQQFPSLQEVYNILKQHKINFIQDILYLQGLHFSHRIHALHQRLPDLAALLTVENKRKLLRIANNRDYYSAQRYYLTHD